MEKVTVEYDVYTFDELSKEAQETALQTWINNYDFIEMQEDVDLLQELLYALNLPYATIHYSGFWSQGDGLCFVLPGTCVDKIDLEKLEKIYPKKYWEWAHTAAEKLNEIQEEVGTLWIQSVHRGNYYHSRSVDLDVQIWEDVEDVYEEPVGFPENVETLLRELMDEMYVFLEKNYNYYSSMECFQEIVEGNEWRFLKNGEQFD